MAQDVWHADRWLYVDPAKPDEVIDLTVTGYGCGILFLFCRDFWLTIGQDSYALGSVRPQHRAFVTGELITERPTGLDRGSITVDGLQATLVSGGAKEAVGDCILPDNYLGVLQGDILTMQGEANCDFDADGFYSPVDVAITWSRCPEEDIVGTPSAGGWCRP